jgi:hypothetical protein
MMVKPDSADDVVKPDNSNADDDADAIDALTGVGNDLAEAPEAQKTDPGTTPKDAPASDARKQSPTRYVCFAVDSSKLRANKRHQIRKKPSPHFHRA